MNKGVNNLSRHSSGGLYFDVNGQGENWTVIIPRELLEDEVGDNESLNRYEEWVEDNMVKIMEAYKAKTSGGMVTRPFDQIVVEVAS